MLVSIYGKLPPLVDMNVKMTEKRTRERKVHYKRLGHLANSIFLVTYKEMGVLIEMID